MCQLQVMQGAEKFGLDSDQFFFFLSNCPWEGHGQNCILLKIVPEYRESTGCGGEMGETGTASNALSGKATLLCWPLYQTAIYNLVSGRKRAPSSNF